MRKGLLSFIMIGIFASILPMSMVVGKVSQQFWQNWIDKPPHAWTEAYGADDKSQLAYNVWVHRRLFTAQDVLNKNLIKRIEQLEKNYESNCTTTGSMSGDPNCTGDNPCQGK